MKLVVGTIVGSTRAARTMMASTGDSKGREHSVTSLHRPTKKMIKTTTSWTRDMHIQLEVCTERAAHFLPFPWLFLLYTFLSLRARFRGLIGS